MREPIRKLNGDILGYIEDGEFTPVATTEFGSGSHPSIDSSSGLTHSALQTIDRDSISIEGSNGTKFHCGILTLDSTQSNQQLIPEPKSVVDVPQSNLVVAPAPEGDALIDLIDDVCLTVENFFGSMRVAGKTRLHSDLRVSDGQHSTVLTDGLHRWGGSAGHGGVRSWIVEGTLRSTDELTPALNAFLAMMTRRQRMRRVEADWTFDSWGVSWVGSKFGLPAPPSLEEIAKRDAERVAEYEGRRQRNAEDARKMKAERVTQEEKDKIEDRIRDLLRRVAIAFHQLGDADGELDMSGDTVPEAYHVIMRHRKNFKKFSEALVRSLVEQGRKDTEIMEYIEEFSRLSIGEWGSSVPDPLDPQDIRYWFTLDEFKAFYADSERVNSLLDRYDITSSLGMDGRWVVTLTPRREDV